MEEAAKNIAHLMQMREKEHFTATRIGSPGCQRRLEAQDNYDALDWAISELKTRWAIPKNFGE